MRYSLSTVQLQFSYAITRTRPAINRRTVILISQDCHSYVTIPGCLVRPRPSTPALRVPGSDSFFGTIINLVASLTRVALFGAAWCWNRTPSKFPEIIPIHPRRRPRHALKHSSEMALASEPNSRGDVGDRIRSRTQHNLRVFDPPSDHILM